MARTNTTPASIDWIPNLKTYVDREKLTLPTDPSHDSLPAGFPAKVDTPLVWTGADLQPSEYVIELSPSDITEIEAALAQFKCLPPPPLPQKEYHIYILLSPPSPSGFASSAPAVKDKK
jgi:hypothetical protein